MSIRVFGATVAHNGLATCARVFLVRLPVLLPFWALRRIGELAERVMWRVDKACPGLEPVPPEDCELFGKRKKADS